MFTEHWQYLAVRAATQVGVFDVLYERKCSVEELCSACGIVERPARDVVRFLVASGYLYQAADCYGATEKGRLLAALHPQSVRAACVFWGDEHLDAWQQLAQTLRKGQRFRPIGAGQDYFSWLASQPARLEQYHAAMAVYALSDYQALATLLDLSGIESLVDVGGGKGILLEAIARQHPHLTCILFDRPEVVALCKHPSIATAAGDFFTNSIPRANAALLCRVLHDWPDAQALQILQAVRAALPKGGRLFVVENLPEQCSEGTPLLNLNMQLMCNSRERSKTEYLALAATAGFDAGSCSQVAGIIHLLSYTAV